MSEPTRQDDPTHIPTIGGDQQGSAASPLTRTRRRLIAFGIATAALLVPATAAAAAVAEHHRHPPVAVAWVDSGVEARERALTGV